MDLDERITIAKDLIARREEIDRQLAVLFGGASATPRLVRVCSKCGQSGHAARSCSMIHGSAHAPSPT
jgi:hypothetical protein